MLLSLLLFYAAIAIIIATADYILVVVLRDPQLELSPLSAQPLQASLWRHAMPYVKQGFAMLAVNFAFVHNFDCIRYYLNRLNGESSASIKYAGVERCEVFRKH
jgi:hypothetical protein